MAETRICSIEGCGKNHRAKGLCRHHYRKLIKHGDPLYIIGEKKCSVDGCEGKRFCQGWCIKHYSKWRKYGDPLYCRTYEERECSIDGCVKKHFGKGFCRAHYSKFLTYGDPLYGRRYGDLRRFIDAAIEYTGDECFTRDSSGRESRGITQLEGVVIIPYRVVCEAVHGASPTPLHEVAHSCGRGHIGCCTPRHLRWATKKENMADKLIHGTHSRGERSVLAKLTEDQVKSIKCLIASGKGNCVLGRMFNVHPATIGSIRSGKTWAWLNTG
jgi:HNH endonuclease